MALSFRKHDLANGMRLIAHAGELRARAVQRRLRQSRLVRWRYNGPPLDHLLIVPQDLRTADPSFTNEIYHGQFGLAGAVAATGSESPFLIRPPSQRWQHALHGFGWLRHLRASDDRISREHARALVRDWIVLHETPGGPAWLPEVTARRIVSWLSHSTIVLEGADREFYDDVLESLARQMRYLRAAWRDAPEGPPRLLGLTALILAGLCVADQQGYVEDHVRPFAEELDLQILADGCHLSRNPATLIELLLDLLPLRQCFLARDRPPPPALAGVVDRMMPTLRFFRMGGGELARFNGMGATPIDLVAAVLAYDDVQGQPVSFASQAGYYRAQRGSTVLLADVGRPPPLALSAAAHAGCLSFEFSSGRDLIVCNCGAPGLAGDDWRLAARSTAAHSTVTVCNASSGRVTPVRFAGEAAAEGRLLGPDRVTVAIEQPDGAVDIAASHDGYLERFGIVHARRLLLSADGRRLTGEDRLTAPEGLRGEARRRDGAFVVRFHLHPLVRAQLSNDGRTALLVTPGHEGWLLNCTGATLAIEESVYLADNKSPRQTTQAVMTGALGAGGEARVTWMLEKSVVRLSSDGVEHTEKVSDYEELPLR